MSVGNSKVYCPLMDEEVDSGTCFDIAMVVDDGAPAWTAPAKALAVKNFKKICSECIVHYLYFDCYPT